MAGVEAEFARKLAAELGREAVFIPLAWTQQFPALESGDIDMVMSGMSITRARAYWVNFTYPYMTAGLTPLFRRNDYASSGMIPSIVRHQTSSIGCVKDTTGAIFTRNAYIHADITEYSDWEDAIQGLRDGEVTMVIHDAPAVWWAASRNEDELVAFAELLNHEKLAWAIAKTNPELLVEVNEVLEQWKETGEGINILKNWFPGM